MKLNNTIVKNAKATGKTQKLSDGRGMFLEISPTGNKWWRYKYRIDGKEKKLALGVYPEITLKEAREKLSKARKLVSEGIDPIENKQALKNSRIKENKNTFEVIAREWHTRNIENWTEKHGSTILKRLEQNIFPSLGNTPISKILPHHLLKTLNKVEDRGAIDTAHRILQYCTKVCRYAILTNRLEQDFTIGVKEVLKPHQKSHLASITDPKKVSPLLHSIENYSGYPITKLALKLLPLVFVRPGELRNAEWSEIDFEKKEWNIPAEKMKMRQPHLVPLSKQAIIILKETKLMTSHSKYIFPSITSLKRPMSDNTLNLALRRMDYTKEEMTAHGFRAMARTLLDEELKFRPDIIEHQLSHAVKDPNGRAYNRTKHLEERVKMMQDWADYLDTLKLKVNDLELITLIG
jgi:integrase